MWDVIIAGAGPVGLYLAGLLESRAKVLILERSKAIGHKTCSGLVSTRLSEFVSIDKVWLEHKVKGAVLHSPGGYSLRLFKERTAAYVIDRHRFDRWLAKRLSSPILLATEVQGVNAGKYAEISTNRGKFISKVVVGADGCNSCVGKGFRGRPEEVLTGLVAIINKRDVSENVEIWYDPEKLPDGFYWKIPRGRRTEYGMLGKGVSFGQLEQFFGIRNYKKSSAPIILGKFKTCAERIVLVGDAAGQIKPWSGGGIIYGFLAAGIAAKVILRALEREDFSKAAMAEYEIEWKAALYKYIRGGLFMRKFYSRMPNFLLDAAFTLIKPFQPIMSRADMDLPSNRLCPI